MTASSDSRHKYGGSSPRGRASWQRRNKRDLRLRWNVWLEFAYVCYYRVFNKTIWIHSHVQVARKSTAGIQRNFVFCKKCTIRKSFVRRVLITPTLGSSHSARPIPDCLAQWWQQYYHLTLYTRFRTRSTKFQEKLIAPTVLRILPFAQDEYELRIKISQKSSIFVCSLRKYKFYGSISQSCQI